MRLPSIPVLMRYLSTTTMACSICAAASNNTGSSNYASDGDILFSLQEYWQNTSGTYHLGILLLTVGCACLMYCVMWYQQLLHATKRYGMPVMISPPEGPSYPLIGQLINFLRYRPWDLMTRWNHRYGPIVCFPLLGKNMFTIASPNLLKIVLQSKIQAVKKDVHNTMKHFLVILGTGIVTSEDDSWMHQRVKMSLPLRRDVLEMIPSQTLQAVQNLMREMDQAAETGDTIPLGSSLRHLTLQVISGTFLSLTAQESNEHFAKLYLPIVDESNMRVWHPYRAYAIFLPFWWIYLWNVYSLNRYVSRLIRKRWQLRRKEDMARQQQDIIRNGESTGKPLPPKVREQDILDKVLAVYEKECGDSLPPELPGNMLRQFRDEMKTFMLAGHETSAAMMTWTLYELMGDEDRLMQPTLREAERVFGPSTGQKSQESPSIDWAKASCNDLPSADELTELQFAEASLRESLRKYSVVPVVTRRTVQDLYMENKYFVPKGSSLVLNIQAVHWNPEYWPEPNKFDPNRFLTQEATDERDPYTFLAFIAGPRNCLGQHLALLESKMVIALLVHRYRLSMDERVETADWSGSKDPRHRFTVPAIPKEELMVRVQRRKTK